MKIKIPFFKRKNSQHDQLVEDIAKMLELEEIVYNKLMTREHVEKLTELYSVIS